jgi:Ca2+-binding RTX toxin-like protein
MLTGTSGSDNIFGLGGQDTIDAGDGDDLVVLRAQTTAFGNIMGGLGIDTLRIDRMYTPINAIGGAGAYALNFTPLSQTASTIISGFERLAFNSLAGDQMVVAMLYGGAAGQTNQIGPGLAANAELIGGAGDDILTLSYNASVAGSTVTAPSFTYTNWTTPTRAYLSGDRVNVAITGSAGATLNGTAHAGVQGLSGSAGNDVINGSDDMDSISGGAGGADFLYGNGGDDALSVVNTYLFNNGTAGSETTRSGANTLYDGGSGFDFLVLGGNVNFQGTLQNIEGLVLIPSYFNANSPAGPILLGSQYLTTATFSRATFSQLPSNLLIDGYGTLIINLANGGDSFDGSQLLFDVNADIFFDLRGGDGDDTITGARLMDNRFDGGAGNDTFNGGLFTDEFYLNGGTDSANGSFGDDVFILTGGTNASIINGGDDFDALVVETTTTFTGTVSGIETVTLETGATLNISAGNMINGFAPSTTIFALGGGSVLAVGLSAGDTNFIGAGYSFGGATMLLAIIGNTQNNVLAGGINTFNYIDGGDGADQIKGFTLGDTLIGGGGVDKIIGNGGSDTLTGGTGNDVFKFRNATDSGLGLAADKVTDFVIGADRLNFVRIDANASVAGDQAFGFVGTAAFTNTGVGQIRYQDTGINLLVQADVNGDGIADMEVVLQGVTGGTLTAADFVL